MQPPYTFMIHRILVPFRAKVCIFLCADSTYNALLKYEKCVTKCSQSLLFNYRNLRYCTDWFMIQHELVSRTNSCRISESPLHFICFFFYTLFCSWGPLLRPRIFTLCTLQYLLFGRMPGFEPELLRPQPGVLPLSYTHLLFYSACSLGLNFECAISLPRNYVCWRDHL